MMKIFHAKGTCSIGILVIAEEFGITYGLELVDLVRRDQYSPEYIGRNPKAKVPLLELDDGDYLTEWPAIAAYLALSSLQPGMLATDPLGLARALEAVDYIVSTVHMQGFTRIVRPGLFTPDEANFDQVKSRGREIFDQGLRLIDERLTGREFLLGDFSIADGALFYIERWMVDRLDDALPARCKDHYERMLAREPVQRALSRES
jgi:glutathione S-transferase